MQLWACFPEPSGRSDRFKIQESGLQGVHKQQLHTAQSEDRGGGTFGNPGQVALTAHRLSLMSKTIVFQKLGVFPALLTWKTRNTDTYSRLSVILHPICVMAECKDAFQIRQFILKHE